MFYKVIPHSHIGAQNEPHAPTDGVNIVILSSTSYIEFG